MTTTATVVSLNYSEWNIPAVDQEMQGACEANAVCVDIQKEMLIAHHPVEALARQFMFNDAHIIMGTFPSNGGLTDAASFSSTITHGIAKEAWFGYGGGDEFIVPPPVVYDQAATQKALSYTNISIYQNYMGLVNSIAEQIQHGKGVLASTLNMPVVGMDTIWGGHKIFFDKVDYVNHTLGFQNSYGPNYGVNADGHGEIKFTDALHITALDVCNGFAGIDLTYTTNKTMVSEIICTGFNRSMEANGIQWYSHLMDGGLTATNAANGIFASAESHAIFDGLTNQQTADILYFNATGRHDNAAYFSHLLDSGYTKGDVTINLINAVWNGYDTVDAHDRMVNRVAVSNEFGIAFQADDFHHAASVASLVGITNDANTVEAGKLSLWHALG